MRETWQRLDSESQEIQTAYWKWLRWFDVMAWDSEDLAFAVHQLLTVQRSSDVVKWLALRSIPYKLVIQILEAIPADVAASAGLGPHVDDFRIAHLFKVLDQSDEVPDSMIARLEIPYVGILGYNRPQLALHREVAKDPSLFADLITWAFKRSDGQAEEAVDDHTRERRATLAYSLVWKLRILPGLMEDGSCGRRELIDMGQ